MAVGGLCGSVQPGSRARGWEGGRLHGTHWRGESAWVVFLGTCVCVSPTEAGRGWEGTREGTKDHCTLTQRIGERTARSGSIQAGIWGSSVDCAPVSSQAGPHSPRQQQILFIGPLRTGNMQDDFTSPRVCTRLVPLTIHATDVYRAPSACGTRSEGWGFRGRDRRGAAILTGADRGEAGTQMRDQERFRVTSASRKVNAGA